MQIQARSDVINLVPVALSQTELSGFAEVLKGIAEAVDAFGCILWQVQISPTSERTHIQSAKHLFMLAEWFQGNESCPLYLLPINHSVTGRAVLDNETKNIEDIWSNEQVYTDHSFLEKAGVNVMCSVPISFRDEAHGAVNLYRKEQRPFSQDELIQIEQLASLIPAMYQSLHDKVSLGLISSINNELHEAELSSPNALLTKPKMKEVIQKICDLVTAAYQCLETSIFLEDRLEVSREYRLMATTWPEPLRKVKYKRSAGEGLTGWVLEYAKPLKVFDLARFNRDRKSLRREYRGLVWKDSLDILNKARKFLDIDPSSELPPLSFMATPIVRGDKVYGVIRCSGAKKGLYYFGERELNTLNLIAAQISRFWVNWLGRREMQEEIVAWRSFLKGIGTLNNFVHDELTREAAEAPNEKRIYAEALRLTSSIIKGAEILDVRLLNEKKRELEFFETYGKAWDEGDPNEVSRRKHRRFTVTERPPRSAGSYVMQTGQVYVMPNVRDTDCYYSETFPKTECMIVAPIGVKTQFSISDPPYGVLDIRGTGKRDFPPHAEIIAELLGRQLGLYRYLAMTIGKLRRKDIESKERYDELQRVQREQTQTYEDLKHQLRTPVIQAHKRVKKLLRTQEFQEDLRSKLWAIRGLCRKANRVVLNTSLFENLAREKPIQIKLLRLQYDDTLRLLIEAATDTELMLDQSDCIKFEVDRPSFDLLKVVEVRADLELLEQAVNCLLDNAGKYSQPDSVVRIRGRTTHKGKFQIGIINKGLKLTPTDALYCVRREWRSNQAKWVTEEGSGIGLWIVDNIMQAHGGELSIIPTTQEGLTEVRLIFPILTPK